MLAEAPPDAQQPAPFSIDLGVIPKDAAATIWANGRDAVWDAADAQAATAGLVDQLGSLDEAVAAAAELAGIVDYERRLIEQSLTPAQLFLQQIADNTLVGPPLKSLAARLHVTSPVERLVAGLQRELRDLLHLNDPNALYLKCFQCVAPVR